MRPNLIERITSAIRKKHPDQQGRELTWLAEQLGLTIQTVHSWKGRGKVPAERHAEVARVLGITVDQLIGEGPVPAASWPLPGIPRELIDSLAPNEVGIVEAAIMQGLKQVDEIRAVAGQFRKRQG